MTRKAPTRQFWSKKKICSRPGCENCLRENCYDMVNCQGCRAGHRCPARACPIYEAERKARSNGGKQCSECGSTFATIRNLARHKREVCGKHRQEAAPYRCTNCKQAGITSLCNFDFCLHLSHFQHRLLPERQCPHCLCWFPANHNFNRHRGPCGTKRQYDEDDNNEDPDDPTPPSAPPSNNNNNHFRGPGGDAGGAAGIAV